MGSAIAQETVMRCDRIEMSWKQLKASFVFRLFWLSDDVDERFDRVGAEISKVVQSDASHPAAFCPDDRGRRSEFSQHIGC
jgi:hypothetical protein